MKIIKLSLGWLFYFPFGYKKCLFTEEVIVIQQLLIKFAPYKKQKAPRMIMQALQHLSHMAIEDVLEVVLEGNMSDEEATAAASIIEFHFPTPNRQN